MIILTVPLLIVVFSVLTLMGYIYVFNFMSCNSNNFNIIVF